MRAVAAAAGLLTGLLIAGAAAHAAPTERFTTSDQCGMCHRDIYQMWRESVHGKAMDNPAFLGAYREIESGRGASSPAVCLGCHAPMANVIGDTQLKRRISWEGVTCDFCHSLVDVELKDGIPVHRADVGSVKRGPIHGAESTGHDVAQSDLFTRSIICAPCHEYTTADGTAIMSTYSEWKSSRAAEQGQTCQVCHMTLVEADVVDPRIKRETGAAVNLHQMPGGHSLEQLHKALSVSIDTERAEDRLDLTVRLKNKGAGHAVPTGMPGRRMVLELTVDPDTGQTFQEHRTYGKYYADATGKTIEHVADLFAEGLQLQSDTRIGVDDVRVENFEFEVQPQANVYVTVKLHYEHAPRGPDEKRVWLTFFAERRMVRPAE